MDVFHTRNPSLEFPNIPNKDGVVVYRSGRHGLGHYVDVVERSTPGANRGKAIRRRRIREHEVANLGEPTRGIKLFVFLQNPCSL